jgi:hypothetical protein
LRNPNQKKHCKSSESRQNKEKQAIKNLKQKPKAKSDFAWTECDLPIAGLGADSALQLVNKMQSKNGSGTI